MSKRPEPKNPPEPVRGCPYHGSASGCYCYLQKQAPAIDRKGCLWSLGLCVVYLAFVGACVWGLS